MPLTPNEFAVATALAGHTASLTLRGEFDMTGEADAQGALAAILASDPGILVLDLSELDFIDSSGVRWLVLTRERCMAEGRRLLMVPASPRVRRVLTICDLEHLFELVPSVDATTELIPLPVAPELLPRSDEDGIAATA